MNRTRIKVAAIASAIAITASACGGGTQTETDAAQAQIDALQAQVDELESQADDPVDPVVETTTTTVAEAEADIVVEATTTTVAEEVIEGTSEEVVEPEPDGNATAAPASPGEGFAEPAGSQFDATTSPDDLHALILDMAGPTDDAAGQFARIAPFPALTTLPDTVIEGADFWAGPGEVEFSNVGWGITAEFTTTAAPEDVALAYQAELALLVGGEATSGIIEDDDFDVHWAEVGDYRVSAFEWRQLTSVSVRFSTLDGMPPEIADKITGLRSQLDLDDEALLKRLSLTSVVGSQAINVFYELPGKTIEETQAILDDALADAGWVESDESFNVTHAAPDVDAAIRVTVDSFNEDKAIISVDYSYLN